MVEVALAEGEQGAVADEDAEFEGGVEVRDVFAEDQMVGDWGVGLGLGGGSGGVCKLFRLVFG